MKRLGYIGGILSLVLSSCLMSCSDDSDKIEYMELERERVPIAYRVEKAAGMSSDLDYALYIFSRPVSSTASYVLVDSIHPLTSESRLRFANDSLAARDFRFLFVATSQLRKDIKVSAQNHSVLSFSTVWEDIRLEALADSLSLNNYYDVKDLSGKEILKTDSIHGDLTRIVGQMVFDFFKIGTGLDDRQPIDTSLYASIFDRVYQIKIEYSGCVSSLALGNGKILIPQSSVEKKMEQWIVPALNPDFELELPQALLDTLSGGNPSGGRIEGRCLLPASEGVRMVMTLFYYDTTPTCEEEHVHDASCFEPRTLVLNLPATTVAGISVQPDAYTVNKAGIRCNRVIDIGYSSGVNIATSWDTNK